MCSYEGITRTDIALAEAAVTRMNIVTLWLVTFVSSWSAVYTAKRKTGELIYSLEFQSSMGDCENFKNEILDMSNLNMQHESANSNSLNGTIVVNEDIGEEDVTEVAVAAYKETARGREFFYMVSGDFCSHLNDIDMPWSQLFSVLEATDCPIKANTYAVERIKFNLDYAKRVMKHEFVGDYFVTVALQRPAAPPLSVVPQLLSCHGIQLSVIETKVDED